MGKFKSLDLVLLDVVVELSGYAQGVPYERGAGELVVVGVGAVYHRPEFYY